MAVEVLLVLLLLPVSWACAPQKAGSNHTITSFSLKQEFSVLAFKTLRWCCFLLLDYVMVSCFPNTIIANVPECPYGWEIGHLSLGGVCYTGVNTPGFYRFTVPDLTPKNNSYCGTVSEVRIVLCVLSKRNDFQSIRFTDNKTLWL